MTTPTLNPGETYIGRINDQHIILLPGDNDAASWQAQMDWAKSIGGDLPDRVEQALLFRDFKADFKKDWYWSNTTESDDSGWAWCQTFGNGYQDDYRKGNELRARAVRRVKVED